MKLKYAFIALAALGGAALSAVTASAMPLALGTIPGFERRERQAGVRPARLCPHRPSVSSWGRRCSSSLCTSRRLLPRLSPVLIQTRESYFLSRQTAPRLAKAAAMHGGAADSGAHKRQGGAQCYNALTHTPTVHLKGD
jgi:hypothetical protein